MTAASGRPWDQTGCSHTSSGTAPPSWLPMSPPSSSAASALTIGPPFGKWLEWQLTTKKGRRRSRKTTGQYLSCLSLARPLRTSRHSSPHTTSSTIHSTASAPTGPRTTSYSLYPPHDTNLLTRQRTPNFLEADLARKDMKLLV